MKEQYEKEFIKFQKAHPFEKDIKITRYRFKWVLGKVKGLQGNSLDVGCNDGVLAHKMHGEGFSVHGIDVSDNAIEACESNVPAGKFIQAFADEEIPFPSNHFSTVTCLEIIEHVKNPDKLLQELLRVTKQGGVLLITVPVGEAYNHPTHLRYFDFYSLGKLIEQYIDDFKICRIYKDIPTGERLLWAVEVRK
jgi:2-polyprenyl-3-methyl-5-hydroxy-6-metoxy-1,4-benzoquinol methylase|tara:strand:- start:16623 stop:17201 length:579 start_codon:yes stop_codon:yes gene_type:complete